MVAIARAYPSDLDINLSEFLSNCGVIVLQGELFSSAVLLCFMHGSARLSVLSCRVEKVAGKASQDLAEEKEGH